MRSATELVALGPSRGLLRFWSPVHPDSHRNHDAQTSGPRSGRGCMAPQGGGSGPDGAGAGAREATRE